MISIPCLFPLLFYFLCKFKVIKSNYPVIGSYFIRKLKLQALKSIFRHLTEKWKFLFYALLVFHGREREGARGFPTTITSLSFFLFNNEFLKIFFLSMFLAPLFSHGFVNLRRRSKCTINEAFASYLTFYLPTEELKY